MKFCYEVIYIVILQVVVNHILICCHIIFILSLFFLNQLQNAQLSLYVVQPYSLRQQKTEIKEILNKPKSTIFQIPGADCRHSPKFSGGDFQGQVWLPYKFKAFQGIDLYICKTFKVTSKHFPSLKGEAIYTLSRDNCYIY